MAAQAKAIVVYTSKGEAGAFLVYPYLFNQGGEWIGWVTPERDVFSILGHYVGYLNNDPRILRKRNLDHVPAKRIPPSDPIRFSPPATNPLAPLMPELGFDTVDVLLEFPHDLHPIDSGEFKPDLD